jgi:tRNA uridine 5-carboxymethylaminomethyl modification enzyme
MRQMGELALDATLPYTGMQSLTLEARQKLAAIRPATLAQASRIPGVSPNDLQNLVIEIERGRRRKTAGSDHGIASGS